MERIINEIERSKLQNTVLDLEKQNSIEKRQALIKRAQPLRKEDYYQSSSSESSVKEEQKSEELISSHSSAESESKSYYDEEYESESYDSEEVSKDFSHDEEQKKASPSSERKSQIKTFKTSHNVQKDKAQIQIEEEDEEEDSVSFDPQGYQDADDEKSDTFEISKRLCKRHKSVFLVDKKASRQKENKSPQQNNMRRDTIVQSLEKQKHSKPRKSRSFDELKDIKFKLKENLRKKSQAPLIKVSEQKTEQLQIESRPRSKLAKSFINRKYSSDEQGEKDMLRIDLMKVNQDHERQEKLHKKKRRSRKRKSSVKKKDQNGEDISPNVVELLQVKKKKGRTSSPTPGKTPKFYQSPQNRSPKHRGSDEKDKHKNMKRKSPKKKSSEEGIDESVDLSFEENQQDLQNAEPPQNADSPTERIVKVKETYKLTTTRYQGMLDEEYNEDDLELIKINSERNLINSKSEVTWHYLKEYNMQVQYSVNVLRAFISMLTLFQVIMVCQKHYYTSKLSRLRHQLPADLTKVFNKHEFPYFFVELLIILVHFPPFLDMLPLFQQPDTINIMFTILVIFFWLKLISCIELMEHYSPLNSNKGRFVGSLSKTQITTAFLVKAWVKTYPLFAMPFSIFSFLMSNSYVLYVIERSAQATDCYEYDRETHEFSYKNILWCSVISFLTVGYGDYYPTSILGRAINTIVIVGGMISSATIIGLVHECMQLNHEEHHVFKFIKTRKKEQIRKQLAAKLIHLLLKMQVIRQRELNRGNIKWRQQPQIMKLKNEIFKSIDKWKQLNHDLYVSHRRDHDQMSQMNHLRNIEEGLSGIVVQGANIWEGIKTEKLQKKMNVEQSFIKSRHEIQKLQEEITRQVLLRKYQFQKFKTQRFGQSLNVSRYSRLNNPNIGNSFNNSIARKNSYFNRLSSFIPRQNENNKENEVLSQSSSRTNHLKVSANSNLQDTNKKKLNIPVINITNLDHTHQTMPIPVPKFSNSGHQLLALSMQINHSLKDAQIIRSEPLESSSKTTDEKIKSGQLKDIKNNNNQRNNIKIEQPTITEEQDNDEMVSELISDSSSQSATQKYSENVQQQLARNQVNSSYSSFPQNQSYRLDSPDSLPKSKRQMHQHEKNAPLKPAQSIRRESLLSTNKNQNLGIKRTRTQVTKIKTGHPNGLSSLSPVEGLVLMTKFQRQNSNIDARDFVIEEDFEEDQTTPLSRGNRHQDFSQAVTTTLGIFKQESDQIGGSAPSAIQQKTNSNSSQPKEESKKEVSSAKLRQETFGQRQISYRPSLFKRKTDYGSPPSKHYGFLNFSTFRSDRSIIEAIDDMKMEKHREKELKDKQQNIYQNYQSGFRYKLKGFAKISNMEIEKRIETTTKYRKSNGKIFNSDSSSLYGSSSNEQLKNQELSGQRINKGERIQRAITKQQTKKLQKQEKEKKSPGEPESDFSTDKTAKEYKLFGMQNKLSPRPSDRSQPEESLSARRKVKTLHVEVPQNSPKRQLQLQKSTLKIQIPEEEQKKHSQSQPITNVSLVKQPSNKSQSQNSIQQIPADMNRISVIQPINPQNVSISDTNKNLLSPSIYMNPQFVFGGKSPIKFQKQSTNFSEQSAKELQNLLEPIGDIHSNYSGFTKHQINLSQLPQNMVPMNLSNGPLDKSFIFTPIRISQVQHLSLVENPQSSVNQQNNGDNSQLKMPYTFIRNSNSSLALSQKQKLSKQIVDLKDQLVKEKVDIIHANYVLDNVDNQIQQIKSKIMQKFSQLR